MKFYAVAIALNFSVVWQAFRGGLKEYKPSIRFYTAFWSVRGKCFLKILNWAKENKMMSWISGYISAILLVLHVILLQRWWEISGIEQRFCIAWKQTLHKHNQTNEIIENSEKLIFIIIFFNFNRKLFFTIKL